MTRKSPTRPKRTSASAPPTRRAIAGSASPRTGRPTKFSPSVVKSILAALRIGAARVHAAHNAGVSYDAFNDWMKKGARAEAASERESPYCQFCYDVRQAEAEHVVHDLAVIGHAAPESWQASAWRLERRYPHLYGRRVVEHSLTNDDARRALAEMLGVQLDELPLEQS